MRAQVTRQYRRLPARLGFAPPRHNAPARGEAAPSSQADPGSGPDNSNDALGTTAWSLMVNTAITSVLGLVFWVGATRLYSPKQVGEDAALISAMILLSALSQLNLGMGIARLLPQVARHRGRVVTGTYALTATTALALTAGFLVIVPRLSAGLAFLGHDRIQQAALIGAVVLWNVFALQDAVLASARRAIVVPIENGVFGLIKIGLMLWLVHSFSGHGIFAAWLLAMAIVVVPVNVFIFGRALPATEHDGTGTPATVLPLAKRGRVARYLAVDYVAALLSQGSSALLPILVVGVLGRSANAYFYVAFLIAGAVLALAQALSTSLIVEGAHDEANLADLTRRSIRRYLHYVAPCAAVLMFAAPLVLRPFGAAYAHRGTTLLRLLIAGSLPQAVVVAYLAVERVRARVGRVLVVEGISVVAITAGAIVGMHWFGLAGVGVAWFVSQSALALAVLPRLARVIRREPDRADEGVRSRGRSSPRRPAIASGVGANWRPTTISVDIGAAALTALLLVLSGFGVTGSIRTILALAFVTFVPGWALLDYIKLGRVASRAAIAVALSFTVCCSAATGMLWLRQWHPRVLLDALALLCLAAIAWRVGRDGGEQAA